MSAELDPSVIGMYEDVTGGDAPVPTTKTIKPSGKKKRKRAEAPPAGSVEDAKGDSTEEANGTKTAIVKSTANANLSAATPLPDFVVKKKLADYLKAKNCQMSHDTTNGTLVTINEMVEKAVANACQHAQSRKSKSVGQPKVTRADFTASSPPSTG